jgi:hypothetical protein
MKFCHLRDKYKKLDIFQFTRKTQEREYMHFKIKVH